MKVTDFGIAKIKEGGAGSGQTVLTKSGFLLGTPHYMSPEQIREPKDAGAKSDIYSAGVVLYEMLTGALPFNSRSLPKLIDAIYRGEKQTPSALRPEIDKELEAIVLKAMHRAWSSATRPRASSTRRSRSTTPGSRRRPHADACAPMPVPRDAAPSRAAANWVLVHVKDEANEKHRSAAKHHGRPRPHMLDRAVPSGGLAPARPDHLGGGACVLEDLKSANGTYVNNTRVDKARVEAGRRRALRRRSGVQLCVARPLKRSSG